MSPAELRELLELAAKAAGYSVRTDLTYEAGIVIDDGIVWKPHTDDGDSRRLGVALLIEIQFGVTYSVAATKWLYDWRIRQARDQISEVVEYGPHDDPCAATRLAVLRVAAEIGRAMQ